MRRLSSTLLLLALAAAGCPSREVARIDLNQQKQEYKDIPVSVNRDIDILFVIDNSGSMGEEQSSLTTNFPKFINVLESIEGGLPNVHIGVVSSNVGVGGYNVPGCTGDGDDGKLQNSPRVSGCTPPSGAFISDVEIPNCTNPDPTQCRQRNYTGDLAQTFRCIAQLGTSGCGLEQHLEAMRRALDPTYAGTRTTNAGFLRPDAYLAVIFIQDEDDCSARDPAVFNPDPTQDNISSMLGPLGSFRCTEFGVKCDGRNISRTAATYQSCEPRSDSYLYGVDYYVQFVRSLKPDPTKLIFAGIMGNPTPFEVGLDEDGNPELLPSCGEDRNQPAAPAVRMKAFLDQFPNRNTFTSICNEDLSDALVLIAELLKKVIGNPCLEANIDVTDIQPNTPGTQIDCQVSDVRYPETDMEEQKVIPRCDQSGSAPTIPAGATACWYVEPDTTNCTSTSHNLALVIKRTSDPPEGTHVIARCKSG